MFLILMHCSFLIFCLVFHAENFLQTGRHVVRLLCASIVLLGVDEEAKEERVDGHRVDGEEGRGDEVGD